MKIKEIKRFSNTVYEAVLKLLPQLEPGIKLPSREHFKEMLRAESAHFFVAESDEGQVAGILTVVTYKIPTGTRVWIEDVVECFSEGSGKRMELTLFAIGFARSLGAESVELTSRPSRIAANQLYRKTGFILRETNVYRYPLVIPAQQE
jgi:ribosomal protein S18 acetylase RimI-like enzyme